MNKKSTLIYQFNTLNPSTNVLFDLNEFLKEEAQMKDRLKGLRKLKLKSPRIKVLEKYNII